MKKFYIFSMCALLCAGTAVAGSRFKSAKSQSSTKKFKTESAVATWRPTVVTEYMYIEEEGGWLKLGSTTCKYDSRGNAVEELTESEDDFKVLTTSTFDEYGNVLTRLEMMDEVTDGKTVPSVSMYMILWYTHSLRDVLTLIGTERIGLRDIVRNTMT